MDIGSCGGSGNGGRAVHERRGQRREIRLPVQLAGTIVADGAEPVRVHVADLSRGGARCHLTKPPAVGSPIELRLDGLRISAVICWVSSTACGLRFIGELRATQLLIQSGKNRPIAGDGPDRSRNFVSANGQARWTSG
jgi:hypothetical protein